ncbi:MAG: hypothetical protein AAB490_05430 [Patescibacteria group bacterium]
MKRKDRPPLTEEQYRRQCEGDFIDCLGLYWHTLAYILGCIGMELQILFEHLRFKYQEMRRS